MPALEFAVWDQMQTYEVLHAQSAADVYDTHIRQAQLMERVGFGYYWTLEHQGSYVGAITSPQIFLTALAHQPSRWYSYQDWGTGGPVKFLAERGIEFTPVRDIRPVERSWYDGCGCNETHWRETQP